MSASDISQLKTNLSDLRNQVTNITKNIINSDISGASFLSETKFTGNTTFSEAPTVVAPNSATGTIATQLFLKTKTNTLTNTINNTLGLDDRATTVNLATGSSMTSFNIHTNTNINGNLTVTGENTSIETNNTVFTDRLVGLNNGLALTKDCGIIINRGSAGNAFIGFDESHDRFVVGTTQESADTTETNLTVTPVALNVSNLLLNETPITGSNKVLGSAVQLKDFGGITNKIENNASVGLMLDLVTDGGLEITTDNKLQIKEDGVTNGMLVEIKETGKVAGSAVQLKVGGGLKNDNGLMIDNGAITSSRLAANAVDLSSDRVTGVLPVANGGTVVTINPDLLSSLGITPGFKAFATVCRETVILIGDNHYVQAESSLAAGEVIRMFDPLSINAAYSFNAAGDKYMIFMDQAGTADKTAFVTQGDIFLNYISNAENSTNTTYKKEQYNYAISLFDNLLSILYNRIIGNYQKAIYSYNAAAQLFTGVNNATSKSNAETKSNNVLLKIAEYENLMKPPNGTYYLKRETAQNSLQATQVQFA